MYPWDVLAVDETDDKKVIKKAYAKMIRQYRPEDEPEKFQEINQAYQFALQLLKNGQSVDTVLEPIVTADSTTSTQNVAAVEIEQVLDEQLDDMNLSHDMEQHETGGQDPLNEINEDDPEIVLGNEILEQFHQMAFAEYHLKKQAENWAFLEQYHEIQDLQLRDSLSKELFKRVVEYNSFQLKENRTLLLHQDIVKNIAETLEWEIQWKEFQQEFPESYVEHVFRLLEPKTQLSNFSYLALRVATICFEFLIVYGITKLVIMVRPWATSSEPFELFVVSFFIISNIISMCSEISLSYVQFGIGFRLYDKYLNLTDSTSEVKRAFAFHLSMIPFYLVYYDISTYLFIMVPVIVMLAVINLIFWVKFRQLFHDWISGTILMK